MVNWLSPILLLLHPFNGLFSRTTWASRYQKGKNSLDWNEARDDGVLGCSGMSWTICKQSAPRSRQITSPTPHSSRPVHWQKTTSKVSWLQSYSGSKWIVRRYRPGESETICPPADGSSTVACRFTANQKSWRIYVRLQMSPESICNGLESAHLWWPAVAKLQAASVPTT